MSHATLPVRAGDPETSVHAAIKAALGASNIRPVVLDIVREHGPLTHDEVIGQYNRRLVMDPDTPRSSESGIRTRLRELRDRGLIAEDESQGHSKFGNPAKQWVAVDPAELIFIYSADDDSQSDETNSDSDTGTYTRTKEDAA